MRQNGAVKFLFGDHLNSASITTDASGTVTAELRYTAWGEQRYAYGSSGTSYDFTGQRLDSYINLVWYGSRWFDPELGRFIQPDSIIPGVGEGDDPNAVGYSSITNYSPLVVDYHENQFLDQSNNENWIDLEDRAFVLPPVPTNTSTFDRYSYCLNNPIRYLDPTGHNPLLLALAAVTPLGWVAIGVAAAAVVVYFSVPGVQEIVTDGIYQLGEATADAVEEAAHGEENDENQDALVDLAQEAKRKKGVSESDAQTLIDWAEEYNVILHSRKVEQHPNRNFNVPHIRIGPVNHIPVIPLTPRYPLIPQ